MRKSATIKDVAKKAGVSISVVSYVLNNTPGKTITKATKLKVFNAAKELHYVPSSAAKMLRVGSTQTIALVSYWDVSDASSSMFLSGLLYELNSNGYSLLLSDTESTSKKTMSHLLKRFLPCGVVVLPPHRDIPEYNEEDIKKALKPLNIPSVFLKSDNLSNEGIYCDYFKTGYIAAEYLIKKEITKLCYVKSSYNTKSEEARLEGFLSCLKYYNLKPIEILDETTVSNIFKNKEIRGAVTSKSDMAYKIIEYAEQNGISLPKELSIISANDKPFNQYLRPALTAVKLPLRELGRAAGVKILNTVCGTNNPLPQIDYKIIERKSVK